MGKIYWWNRLCWWVGDIWLKLRMLRLYWCIPGAWWRNVWCEDPDRQVCCNGYMCGCYGATFGERWEWQLRQKKEQS